MNNVIQYINQNDVETIAKSLSSKGSDEFNHIKKYLDDSLIDYENKVKDVLKRLSQLVKRHYVGELLIAAVDLPEYKLEKGKKVVVTSVENDVITINAVIKLDNPKVNEYFKSDEINEKDETFEE